MKLKRILTIFLSLAMVLSLLPGNIAFAEDTSLYQYINYQWNSDKNCLDKTTKTLTEAYTVIDKNTTEWSDGWYVVSDDVTIKTRITVSGTVHLLLCNGVTLNPSKGITLNSENTLYIYAQSEEANNMGKLTIKSATDKCAGIGGTENNSCGTVIINGGSVTATGGIYAAGIGGGYNGSGSEITINGGIVTAVGTSYSGRLSGAGIGGGCNGSGGNITMNGGTVTAKAGTHGAGIGGGCAGSGGNITINRGTVTANGGNQGAGIGGGESNSGGNITINGGTVTAKGGNHGAGIGGGSFGSRGNITIKGGTVTATGSTYSDGIGNGFKGSGGNATISGGNVKNSGGTIKDSNGSVVSCKTYTLDGVTSQKLISDISGVSYGINDFYTLDTNKIYVYLPSGNNITAVTLSDGQVFEPKTDGGTGLYCSHLKANGDYCAYCGGYTKTSEPTTTDGVYQLSSLEELVWFADYVKSENTAAKAILTADINTLSAPNCKIGTSEKPYTGTFDGNGHTVTLALSGGDYSALFPYVKGATIKNLNTKGTIAVSSRMASGLVGYSSGSTTLENCMSFVTINSSVSGDAIHGGLVANATGKSLTINNCAFMGAIKGKNTQNCGGLVGWAAVSTKISNSYVAANFDIDESGSSNTIARNPGKVNISNCYYTNALGYDGTSAEYVSEEQVKNGELAYKLNGSAGGGNRWYQNIDNGTKDNYPVPNSSHGIVYYGYADCSAMTANFTNTYTKKSIQGHNGGMATCLTAGYCADCGVKYLEKDPNAHETNDTYCRRINDTEHGTYHSCCNALIEAEKHTSSTEVATCTGVAKCDVCKSSYGSKDAANHTGELEWVDTGYGEHEHKYTCCGVVTETEKHNLVYEINDDTDVITVKCTVCADDSTDKWNSGHGTVALMVDDKVYDGKSVTANYKATGFMSGWSRPVGVSFEYCCEGGCKTAGIHTVTMHVGDAEVKKEFTITKKPLTVTKVNAFNKAYDMTNVVFVNSIDLDGIVVYKQADSFSPLEIKDNVEIDLSEAVVTVADSKPGSYDTASIANIILSGSDKDNYSIAEAAEDIEIKEGANDYRIWQISVSITPNDQTLYGDSAVIDQTAYMIEGLDDIYTLSGEFLYEENGKIKVDTAKIKITYGDEDVTGFFDISAYYTGNVVRYCEDHYFDENGFCATGECDSYETAILITKENCGDYGLTQSDIDEWTSKYAICNAGQLYWFADRVNNYMEYDISGILVNDITVNEDLTAENLREWVPIACNDYSYYNGNFYGNGHTVSGLYCKDENKNVGFFGNLGYYSLTDLHIANSYFEGNCAGGIAGYSNGATITKCSVANDVTVKGPNAGGLVGTEGGYGTIENCFALAEVSGNIFGGLVGQNYATVKNCFTNAMQPVGYGGTLTNVFYGKDTRDYSTPDEDGRYPQKPTFEGATEVTDTEDFKSGKIAYLLQQGVTGELSWDENGEAVYGEPPLVWGQASNTVSSFPILTSNEKYRVLPVISGETAVCYTVLHKGDINNDSKVDVDDYQQVINVALSETNKKTDAEVYDLNGDGTINLLDCSTAQANVISQESYNKLLEVVTASENTVCYCENADINGDGIVNVLDCSLLELMLSGIV